MSGSAIRTFMIADVRGYTSYTQTYGDEAAGRLAGEFARITREVVDRRRRGGGSSWRRGDELFAVFDPARAAIGAASVLQGRCAHEAVAGGEMRCWHGRARRPGRALGRAATRPGRPPSLADRVGRPRRAGSPFGRDG